MRRILVLATNLKQASFRVRIAAIAPLLQQRGFELEFFVRPRGLTGWPSMHSKLRSSGGYHAVILQRKFLSGGQARTLRKFARRIIYDIDDALMYHNRAVGAVSRWRTARHYAATTPILDHVVAGNQYLAQIFRDQGRTVTVIPTVLSPERYRVKTHFATDTPRLVWIGSRSTLPYLEDAMPAIETAAKLSPGLRLVTIADVSVLTSALPVEHIPWSEAGEVAALLKGDIGIAPTPSDPWTQGKCGFKILQYMASGLPVVASPVGVNADIVQDGQTGYLCRDWSQWPEAIARLADDVSLRARMGQAGRQLAETDYSLERAADQWAEILTA